jgi:LysM repeat protein
MNRLTRNEVELGQVLLVPQNGTAASSDGTASETMVAAAKEPAPEVTVARVAPPTKKTAVAPKIKTHKVRKGETLGSIAARYGRSIAEVKRANKMRGSTVVVGQVLRIP